MVSSKLQTQLIMSVFRAVIILHGIGIGEVLPVEQAGREESKRRERDSNKKFQARFAIADFDCASAGNIGDGHAAVGSDWNRATLPIRCRPGISGQRNEGEGKSP